MLKFFDILLYSRGFYYLLGVGVVLWVLFATAAKTPSPLCPSCRQANRTMARYCAHCGHQIDKKP